MLAILIQITIGLAIVAFLMAAVLLIINLLPVSFIAASIATTAHLLGTFNTLLPHFMLSLFLGISFLTVVEGMIGLYKAIRWVYQKFPGIN
jgi:hypothetical protein